MAHLTQFQRYTISCLLKQNKAQAEIALAIGKDLSVVSREIKRNSDQRSGVYKDELANKKYDQRQREKNKKRRFTPEVQQSVEDLLEDDYSPEQIVGTLKKQGKKIVSTERIYQYVWLDKKGGALFTHLRTQGKRYRKRGNSKDSRGIIQNRTSIEKRPRLRKMWRIGDHLGISGAHEQAAGSL